jgi:hypothetical protein
LTLPQEASEVDQLLKHYREVDALQLAELHDRSNELTESARAALSVVIEERGIDLNGIRQQRIVDDQEMAEVVRARIEKFEKRDERWLKIVVFIGIPLFLVALLLTPKKSVADIVAAVTQAIILTAISCVAYWFRKRRRNKSK